MPNIEPLSVRHHVQRPGHMLVTTACPYCETVHVHSTPEGEPSRLVEARCMWGRYVIRNIRIPVGPS